MIENDKPGNTFCLIQKTPTFTTDKERCAEEIRTFNNILNPLVGEELLACKDCRLVSHVARGTEDLRLVSLIHDGL
ncbi:MAG: hypothetical protein GY820_37055 [Gammaproteobacteria bacterium]|nr:hypothetical protein [Gammaproteobacteria bacterium]